MYVKYLFSKINEYVILIIIIIKKTQYTQIQKLKTLGLEFKI